MKMSLVFEMGNIIEKVERFKEQEYFLFGIDWIFYGFLKIGKNWILFYFRMSKG